MPLHRNRSHSEIVLSGKIEFNLTKKLLQSELAIILGATGQQGTISRSLKMAKGPMFQLVTLIKSLHETMPADAFRKVLEDWLNTLPDGEERIETLNSTLRVRYSKDKK